MSGRLIVVGGGEHARVVIEAARTAHWDVLGFVDPQLCAATSERLGVARLGDDAQGLALTQHDPGLWFVLGVAAVRAGPRRRAIIEAYPSVQAWASIVHVRAWISPTASVAAGAVIFAGATVNSGARVGRHCVVNTGSIIEHDVALGDYAQVASGAIVGGGAIVEDGTYLGLGCRIRDHVRVGAGATIGMGAVVVKDVSPGTLVLGAPARPR